MRHRFHCSWEIHDFFEFVFLFENEVSQSVGLASVMFRKCEGR